MEKSLHLGSVCSVCLHQWRVPQFALKYCCDPPPPNVPGDTLVPHSTHHSTTPKTVGLVCRLDRNTAACCLPTQLSAYTNAQVGVCDGSFCRLLTAPFLQVTNWTSSSGTPPEGRLTVYKEDQGLRFSANLTGLRRRTGIWHLHVGKSCDAIGGPLPGAPYDTMWMVGPDGKVTIDTFFNITPEFVVGRVVNFHGPSGATLFCGELVSPPQPPPPGLVGPLILRPRPERQGGGNLCTCIIVHNFA